jgi:epoxyqueuosine reductase
MITATAIKTRAKEIGFDLCGIAPAAAFPELARLPEWLANGYAGEMKYLARSADVRADVRHFLPTARSVIVTATLYEHGDASRREAAPGEATIARYARGADYHHVLAKRLETLLAWMRAQESSPFDAVIFVDKHPVQERVYAQHAGVGWIGKNTCVINPELGSWLLLAGVASSLDLDVDRAAFDQCGSCTICLDACPTGALVEPHVLDATRCISYLTIELHGSIPERLRPAIGNHLYGCDICQEVCPYNLAPATTSDSAWRPSPHRESPQASELFELSDRELHARVDGSAMTYTALSRLRRNLAVVIGNSGIRSSAASLDRPGRGVRNTAPSASTEIVREHVAWAKRRLS